MTTSGKISPVEAVVELRSTFEIIPGDNDPLTVAEHADACCNVWVSNVSNNGKEQNQILWMMEEKFA